MGFFSKLFSSNNDELQQSADSSLAYSSVEEAFGIDFSDMSQYPVQFKKKESDDKGGLDLIYTLKLDEPKFGIFDKVEITQYEPELCFARLQTTKNELTQEVIDFINFCARTYGKDIMGKGQFKSSERNDLRMLSRSWDRVRIDFWDKPTISLNKIKVANLPVPEGLIPHRPYTKTQLEEKFGEISDEIWIDSTEDVSGMILSFDDKRKLFVMGIEYDWENIIGFNYENNPVMEQGQTTTETKVSTGSMLGRAAVGTLVAGPLGGVVGAVTAKRTQTTTQDSKMRSHYTLHIHTNIPSKNDITIDRPVCNEIITDETEMYTINQIQNLISRIVEANNE